MRTPDHPDDLALRVMIGARIYELERLAQHTARTFQRARECTELTPSEIATQMLAILDRRRDREQPGCPC